MEKFPKKYHPSILSYWLQSKQPIFRENYYSNDGEQHQRSSYRRPWNNNGHALCKSLTLRPQKNRTNSLTAISTLTCYSPSPLRW